MQSQEVLTMNLRRKRLRLMRDTQWRGYARTAEGNPITLSQVRSVVSLSVLGNSSQDGTPSPDNPVEVVGTGEVTGNLFDISQITSKNGGYVDNNNKIYVTKYAFISGITPQKFLEMTGLQIGDTLTCRAQYTQMQDYSNGARYINFVPQKSGLIGLTLFDYGSSDKNNGFRVATIPSDFNNDNYYGLYFYGGNISTPIDGEVQAIWSNFAIFKGAYTAETIPQYEPYGYKVAVQASGRNLLNNNVLWTDGYYINSNGIITKNTYDYFDCAYSTAIKVKAMADYTLGVLKSVNSQLATYNRIFECDSNGNNMVEITHVNSNLQNSTLNFQSQTGYVRFSVTREVNTTIDDMTDNLMLLNGTYTVQTLPSYEPYKEPQSFNVYTPEQLHGAGDAHDTVILDFDRRKAELIQEVSFGEFNAEENWYTNTEATNIQKYFLSTNIVKPGNTYNRPILSNIAVYSPLLNQKNQVNAYGFQNGNGWIGYCVDVNEYATVDDFKLYLQEMSSNDTPVRVYVDCKFTPTTTDITALQDWDALPQLRGTWVLTAEGGTEPTLKAEYYSEERSTE